ncbi:MAG TPA: pyridoxamine 5'-phosphate oxidase family protein [Gemmatimonadaceae bacterium]|nr:pyridoxamine 5'-phosphate oxidase family protein [Gemmatimonadaceae bacterium]
MTASSSVDNQASPSLAPDERVTARSTLRVHADRGVPEEVAAILAAGVVAHVAFVVDGQPFAIPMSYHFEASKPARLFLHGGHHSRLMTHLATRAAVCIGVTLVDGLVYSRTALYHSVNYRSAIVFGRALETPPDDAQRALLHAMVERYFPGRTPGRDYEPVPHAHLGATAFVEIAIEEWSAKARRGGPTGPRDNDASAPGTAGVIECRDAGVLSGTARSAL